MPRYGITTFVNKEENEKIEKTAKALDTTKYKLLRESVLAYCEACRDCENGEKEDVRTSEGSSETPREDSGTDKTSEDAL